MPKTTRMAKTGQGEKLCVSVRPRSATAQSAAINRHIAMMRRMIVPVGDRSRDKDQKQRRQKLKKTDQAEIKGVACHLIHLPANGNADDLDGEGRKNRALKKRR